MDSAKELSALNDTIESAMDWEFNNLNGDSVRLWIAAKLRVACLSEAVNEDVLWDSTSSLYDELLDSKMPFSAYQWFNRHVEAASPPRCGVVGVGSCVLPPPSRPPMESNPVLLRSL